MIEDFRWADLNSG